MAIKKLKIKNFKIFRNFEIEFNQGLNIVVGQNNVGKTTIIEAIHLALTGYINGKNIYNDYTENLFNVDAISDYLSSLKTKKPSYPPEIEIEIFFEGDLIPEFIGHHNSEKNKVACGFKFLIKFDEDFTEDYQEVVRGDIPQSLPIEFYKVEWLSFSDEIIQCKKIKVKSILIDSTYSKYYDPSNNFISKIVKNNLDKKDAVSISKVHRKLRENFKADDAIDEINNKLKVYSDISNKNISLAMELLSNNSWDKNLIACLDNIPFNYAGKGEQCIIKTHLALLPKKSQHASVILIEEPENHLSYSNLNILINAISNKCSDRQVIISTHSSFVANKLGLDNIVMLNYSNGKTEKIRFNDLEQKTYNFFKTLSGYDTLRLILNKKVILVEGPSDELIVQKIYYQIYKKLPIENGIDVVSVGNTFVRFLEIANLLNIRVAVVTDSDGHFDALKRKYKLFLKNKNIKICYDGRERTPITANNKINYNTLENYLLIFNTLEKLNTLLDTNYSSVDELLLFMKDNKTNCALKLFEATEEIIAPTYISDAISHVE